MKIIKLMFAVVLLTTITVNANEIDSIKVIENKQSQLVQLNTKYSQAIKHLLENQQSLEKTIDQLNEQIKTLSSEKENNLAQIQNLKKSNNLQEEEITNLKMKSGNLEITLNKVLDDQGAFMDDLINELQPK